MSYYGADYDKCKVVTLRLTQKEYDQLSKVVEASAKKSYWPRKTISNVAGDMICYCLRKGIDVYSAG